MHMDRQQEQNEFAWFLKVAAVVVLALVALVLLWGSWGTINAGHRGVVLRMGRVTGKVMGEGLYFKLPLVESVKEMDVRQQKEEVTTEAASKDLQSVRATVALNLSLKPEKCTSLYQGIGTDYAEKVVAPAMQEGIKAVIARYTAEELISQRELVREGITRLLAEKLTTLGIQVDAVNIANFDFSASFNAAIEAKVTAEQNALAAKNLLAQKQFEAEQAVAVAKGKAQAMEIESTALAKNPEVLQLRALEKWDGVLPRVTGGALPFLDVNQVTQGK